MASPMGRFLFNDKTLAAVEKREQDSLQLALVTQIAHGLASSGHGSSVRAGSSCGGSSHSWEFTPATPSPVPSPPAASSGWSFRIQRSCCGDSRGHKRSF